MARYSDDDFAVDNDAAQSFKRQSSFWKPKDGQENMIRIIGLRRRPTYFRPVGWHYGIGPNNNQAACRALTEDGECLVCEFVRELRASDNEDDTKLAMRMRAKQEFIVAVVDLKDVEKGVQPYKFGKQVYDQLESTRQAPDVGNPFHPERGRNFKVTKEKTGPDVTNVKYIIQPAFKESAIANMQWVEDALECVDTCFTWTGDEKLAQMLGLRAAAPAQQAPALTARNADVDPEEMLYGETTTESEDADEDEDDYGNAPAPKPQPKAAPAGGGMAALQSSMAGLRARYAR